MTNAIDNPNGGHFGGAADDVAAGMCNYSLASILMELAVRAGMDPRTVDASRLQGIGVRGFTVVNQYACSAAMQALSQIFLFDPSNYDGVVHFVPRGDDAVATITEDDLVLDDVTQGANDPTQNTRSDAITIPARLNLNYYDIAGGLATSLQISQRDGDPRATGSQDLSTTIILSADEAMRVVRINHQVMVEDQKNQFNLTLTDKFIGLVPAQNVFVQNNGKVRRARITQIDMYDGKQTYQMLQDRQSAYGSDAQGYPAYIPTPPPSAVIGQTLIEALDIHIISDRDDSLGCYIAVSGQTQSWQGALIELSIDGGANYIDSFTANSWTVMGHLVGTLGAGSPDVPDEGNSCEIYLPLQFASLNSASQAQMQSGANLCIIGNEMLQFGNAAETSTEGTWTIDYFFRGRKSTAPVAHSDGERFVLLTRNSLYYIPAELSYLGRSITLRATSLNGDDTDVVTTTFVYTGQSQVERPVAYLSAYRDTSDDANISWQGIWKLGAGARVGAGVHWLGYQITLTDGSTTQVFNQLTDELVTSLAAFSGPVTITVVQLNGLTGAGPATSVII
jgi:hypothetical protein